MQKKNISHIITLLLFFVVVTVGTTTAQVADYQPKMLMFENLNNKDILNSFEKRFTQIDTMLARTVYVYSPTMRTMDMTDVNSRLDSLYEEKSRQESSAFTARNGLEITGQAYGRLDNIASIRHDADDEDDISRYWAKVQVELGWNIFNSRFYNRNAHLRKIVLENEIDRVRSKKDARKDIFDELSHRLTERYNFYLAVVQYQRLTNIDLLNEAYQFLLEQDRISNDKLLDIINEKMQMEYELSQTYDMESLGKEPLYRIKPTVLMTDTTALYLEMMNRNADLRENELKEEALKNQLALTTYASTMRVSPFARWSGYLTSRYTYSQNIDLGVRFTFPLFNENPKKRKGIGTEIDILRTMRETMSEENRTYCRMRLMRIERLNKAIRTEHLHITQLSNYINLRNNAYSKSKKGYNYIARLEEYNEYLKSMERIYKLMLQRSLTMIEIQKTTGILNLDGIVTEVTIKD